MKQGIKKWLSRYAHFQACWTGEAIEESWETKETVAGNKLWSDEGLADWGTGRRYGTEGDRSETQVSVTCQVEDGKESEECKLMLAALALEMEVSSHHITNVCWLRGPCRPLRNASLDCWSKTEVSWVPLEICYCLLKCESWVYVPMAERWQRGSNSHEDGYCQISSLNLPGAFSFLK